jgi:stage V sporulation protein S
VDRFFSKLDLRDIKIDPFKTSFPPDDEDPGTVEMASGPDAVPSDDAVARPGDADWDRDERRPHVPAWASQGQVPSGSFVEEADVVENAAHGGSANGQSNSEVLKVSARSRPSAVAGAIAGVVREVGRAEVQAIGAGATNQAVKAVAIARDYLRETGIEAICLPAFIDVTIENEDRTAIRLVVEPR